MKTDPNRIGPLDEDQLADLRLDEIIHGSGLKEEI